MPINLTHFLFSQSSLQDYVDCPRRFQLRYMLHTAWPAVETEPILAAEAHMERGQAFHRLLQQDTLGLSRELLTAAAQGAELADWWRSYLEHGPADLPPDRYAEVSLAIPVAGHGLVAKYDLVAVSPDRLVIVDWKTNLRRPSRTVLKARLQTHVYPFVLVQAGAQLTGRPVQADQVEMLYWFAEFPLQTELFRYSQESLDADADRFERLIHEITTRQDEVFPVAEDPRRCRFCVYRSLCEREVAAAPYDEEDADLADAADLALDVNLDQVAEIVY